MPLGRGTSSPTPPGSSSPRAASRFRSYSASPVDDPDAGQPRCARWPDTAGQHRAARRRERSRIIMWASSRPPDETTSTVHRCAPTPRPRQAPRPPSHPPRPRLPTAARRASQLCSAGPDSRQRARKFCEQVVTRLRSGSTRGGTAPLRCRARGVADPITSPSLDSAVISSSLGNGCRARR